MWEIILFFLCNAWACDDWEKSFVFNKSKKSYFLCVEFPLLCMFGWLMRALYEWLAPEAGLTSSELGRSICNYCIKLASRSGEMIDAQFAGQVDMYIHTEVQRTHCYLSPWPSGQGARLAIGRLPVRTPASSYLRVKNWYSSGFPAWHRHFGNNNRAGWPGVSILWLGGIYMYSVLSVDSLCGKNCLIQTYRTRITLIISDQLRSQVQQSSTEPSC